MRPYRLTPAATLDLSEIWDYTATHWDADQAERYVRDIEAAVDRVAADPLRGHPCDDIRPGYRRYAVGSHVLFFTVTSEAVDVIRILHRRMDPTLHV